MNFLDVMKGLKEGKCYQLPGWYRFYIYADFSFPTLPIFLGMAGVIEHKDSYYVPLITDIEQDKWIEVDPEKLKNVKFTG